MEHTVFLSHSSKDRDTAMEVCRELERQDLRCWIAPRDVVPGIPYAMQIVRAIRACRVFVVLFSSHSNESPDVAREVELAAKKDLPLLLPFRIENVAMADELLYFLSGPHWLDATGLPMRDALDRLVTTIRSLTKEKKSEKPSPEVYPPPPPHHPFHLPSPDRYNDAGFSPFYQVRVAAGPTAGNVCLLTNIRADAGSSEDCSIRLGAEPGVEDFHFSLWWDDDAGRYRLMALPTQTGVTVNGERKLEAVLVPGDQITVGSTTMVFEIAPSLYGRQDE